MDKSTTKKQRCIFRCFFSHTHTEKLCTYGSVSVNESQVASHTPASTDANRVFSLSNGELKVSIPAGAGGTIVSTAIFTRRATPRVITFEYNHNGLRTKKTVEEGGVTTTYEYTLHGKLITHMTKRVEDEDGIETGKEELHFFYEEQSVPTFVEYNKIKYHYIHNSHGDVVGVVDANGNLVVEYKYDAWGKLLSVTGSQSETLGKQNPILIARKCRFQKQAEAAASAEEPLRANGVYSKSYLTDPKAKNAEGFRRRLY